MGSAPGPGSADGRAWAAPEDDDWFTGEVRPSVFRSVFQVLSADGCVAGAGFLVDEGTGFTCAHVVRAAGGSPGGRVAVVFPRLPDAPRMTAEVAADGWRAPEADDVAVLRFATVPAAALGLAVGVGTGSRGHRVSSFGFPAQAPWGGHFGYGQAGGLLPAGTGTALLLQLAGANDLTTGFSGAPVVDEVTGLVIGMVTSIASPDTHLKGLGIAYATPAEVLRAVLPRLAERQACPYLGLEPFGIRHARWFHGRATASERVLAALDGNRRLVMLLGPSGAGKSSLLNAGVLPALADGGIAGSDRWLPVCARPGHDLLRQLEDAGLPGAATDGPAAAVRALLAADAGHDRVLLVIDQFEELLTQPVAASGSSDRGAGDVRLDAVEQLVRLIDSHAPVTVLLIMRNDFYASLDALAPALLNAATPGLCNIPATLSRHELLEIITGPAADVGVPLESGLAERIVNDITGVDPTAREAPVTLLPALELTLLQLWRRRRRADGGLTHAAYEKIGEVAGSLSVWCDSALGQLSVEQRRMARRILTALVRPADEDNGIPSTRRIVPLPRLRALTTAPDFEGPAADAAFDTVLAALTRHRIVTTGITATPGAPSGEPAAELIHDALIRDWADLRDWVAQDHRFQVWLQRATEQQARHAHSGLPDDLLQGSLLAEGEEWAGRHPLPAEITAFLAAGRRREQAALRRTRRFNTILAVLLSLALLATGIALDRQHDATTARQAAITAQHAAQSRELAAQSANVRDRNPDLASLLAVKAWRTSHTMEAAAALYAAPEVPLHRRLKAGTKSVISMAFSPDGTTLATEDESDVVRLWDARTGSPRATLAHRDRGVTSMVFSPDGATLATGDGQGVIRLWETRTGRLRTTLAGHDVGDGNGVDSLAFGPDGATLAAGLTTDAVVGELWDVRTRRLRRVISDDSSPQSASVAFSTAGVPFLLLDNGFKAWDMATGGRRRVVRVDDWTRLPGKPAFSLGGAFLAADDGGTMRLWDATMGALHASLDNAYDQSAAALLSPDRRTVVVPSGTVDLWDTRTGARRTALTGLAHAVASTAFNADGSVLATGGVDGEVRLWDAEAGRPRALLTDAHQFMASLAFSPDGATLATGNSGSEKGTTQGIRLWDVKTGRIRRTLADRGEGVWSVAFSPDGTLLATGSGIGDTSDARLFDARNGELVRTLSLGSTADGVSVAFSPDGTTLATGVRVGGRGSVRFWDARTGALRRTLSIGEAGNALSLAFSPDGTTLAVESSTGKVQLWNPATGGLRGALTDPIALKSPVVFSPDGTLLATGSARHSVLLWDVTTGRPRTTLAGTASVQSLAFSPDGTLLATASDNTVRLWDVDGGSLRATLTGNVQLVREVAFSPDGATLTAGNNDGTTLLWDADLPGAGAIAESICHGLGRDFTVAEKTQYLRGQNSAPVCPDPERRTAGEGGGVAGVGGRVTP